MCSGDGSRLRPGIVVQTTAAARKLSGTPDRPPVRLLQECPLLYRPFVSCNGRWLLRQLVRQAVLDKGDSTNYRDQGDVESTKIMTRHVPIDMLERGIQALKA